MLADAEIARNADLPDSPARAFKDRVDGLGGEGCLRLVERQPVRVDEFVGRVVPKPRAFHSADGAEGGAFSYTCGAMVACSSADSGRWWRVLVISTGLLSADFLWMRSSPPAECWRAWLMFTYCPSAGESKAPGRRVIRSADKYSRASPGRLRKVIRGCLTGGGTLSSGRAIVDRRLVLGRVPLPCHRDGARGAMSIK